MSNVPPRTARRRVVEFLHEAQCAAGTLALALLALYVVMPDRQQAPARVLLPLVLVLGGLQTATSWLVRATVRGRSAKNDSLA